MNDDREPQPTESTPSLAVFNRAEVDMQVSTAHAYPRSIKQFLRDAESLVTLNDDVAESCSYALPRKAKVGNEWVTKNIEGPSARFAEIILSCWGNARASTKIVDEGAEFITAQGMMFDLQKNVAIEVNVPRRIVDSNGNRFKVDMIGVTANAAASIALRNAILKVIPKALWDPVYQLAKKTALGSEMTLSNKRAAALEWFQKKGASAQTVFEHLGVSGIEDITLEHIATLLGYKTALKDGDTTVEALFSKDDPAATGKKADTVSVDSLMAGKPTATPAPSPTPGPTPTPTPAPTSAPATSGQPGLQLDGGAPPLDEVVAKMKRARSMDSLTTHYDWRRCFTDPAQLLVLDETFEAKKAELSRD